VNTGVRCLDSDCTTNLVGLLFLITGTHYNCELSHHKPSVPFICVFESVTFQQKYISLNRLKITENVDNIDVAYEWVSINAESKMHIKEFQFDVTRISECLQNVTNNVPNLRQK